MVIYSQYVATVGELFRVARVLREVALQAARDPGAAAPSKGIVLVTDDIARHDNTTVTEIAARTGMAQSLVSKVVAQLHDGGVVDATVDQSDRRRTRLRLTDLARTQVLPERAHRPVTDALRQQLPGLDDETLARVEATLEQLAHSLRSGQRPPAP